ncbi:MAG: hypothetical protein RLZZ241_1924 [Bacteroidota bacterium]|jgi:ABC-2 type transport system ATP-binding protein
MNSFLSIREVTKNFGSYRALDSVSLDIPEQVIFGLLGPNGAGKTTLIRIINQITLSDSGSVRINGQLLAPHHIAQIGYLPEERGLYKSMKVGEQALYLAQLKGLSKADAKKQLQYWFEKLEIGDWWHKKVQELSKGMAQKIQFIVTVLHRPRLLIFDEPFSGFDPINASIIKDQILDLKKEGASIIFSTHRMESVEELCDNIGLMYRSRLILEGRLADIKKRYKQNQYEVLWAPSNLNDFPTALEQEHFVASPRFEPEENAWFFTMELQPESKGEVLQFLTAHGDLMSFREIIPSANEIFIRTVKNQQVHA